MQHKIPKSRSGLEALRKKKTKLPAESTTRMAVAIFDTKDATWFFKVNGSQKQVEKTEDQWLALFDSVYFADGQPKWDAPEDWEATGPKPMRFETLVIPDTEPKLEVAISSLGPDQDLLLNVNRWRGQLGLAPATQTSLNSQVIQKESSHGKYVIFDAEGKGSGQMRPPFAGGSPAAGTGVPPNSSGQSEQGIGGIGVGGSPPISGLSYDAPEGWTEGKTSSIVHARLSKNTDEGAVQITIIEMPADINEWEPNAKRWAGQVGLSNQSAEQLAARTSDIKVDGIDGLIIDFAEDIESENALLAGMIKRNDSAWFLKLSGETELVKASRDEFKAFMKSIRF